MREPLIFNFLKGIIMKADLHVHSKYSTRPSQWILQKINCPESFTEPKEIYQIAKKKGMSLVTITDHNVIDGALEIADLPDAFVSEEVTTYFPRNNCKIHVLAYNITEKNHEDIQKSRNSIFELVEYLQTENIIHAIAHPFYSVNDKLTIENFEMLLLLFKNFEFNGARDQFQNNALRYILSNIKQTDIQRLSEKHDIEPNFTKPWEKNITGGSDDHGSFHIAETYTEVAGAETIEDFLGGIENNRAKAMGRTAQPETLAHNLYGIAYQFYKHRFNLASHVKKDPLMHFINRFLSPEKHQGDALLARLYHSWNFRKSKKAEIHNNKSFQDVIKHEALALIRDDPELIQIYKNGNGDIKNLERKWFEFTNKVSNKVLLHFGNYFFDHLLGANIFSIFNSIGAAGSLYAVIAPYFLSYSMFSGGKQLAQQFKERLVPNEPAGTENHAAYVAHFTDTFYEINGVALTLQQQVGIAQKMGKRYTVITCDDTKRESGREIQNFLPVGVTKLPVYREQKLYYPPFLEMLDYCYNNNFTHIHSSTPGPIGLAALIIARILKLPVNGTYHTSLPQYARYLTGDPTIEDLMWKYVLWYYNQMDLVFVPSMSTGKELEQRGIHPNKIRVFPRGIDVKRFHPSKQSRTVDHRYGLGRHPRLLYVGRVSKEKNLELLADVFKSQISKIPHASLTIVGDGPYLKEMRETLKGTPTVFTGYLEGDALAGVYASCDLFVFPSTTDTFGNVILEAQASGLPVIVTDSGRPQENLIPGKTGLVVRANDPDAFRDGIKTLITNSDRLRNMGKRARQYMEGRAFDKAFNKTWQIYEEQLAHTHTSMAQAV